MDPLTLFIALDMKPPVPETLLEKTYMAGNLLRQEVEASHVGKAFVALALSERTTAHVMTVDGGNIEAALR